VRGVLRKHRPHVAVVGTSTRDAASIASATPVVANGGALRDGGYLVVTDDADRAARRAAELPLRAP
jgi:hypothetical protein